MNNFFEYLESLSVEIGINLNDFQIEKYFNYMNLLIEWNNKFNLTAITEEKDIILKHFIDCMTVFKYIGDEDSVIDVGTGAGFPGIPIAINRENAKITLLDSLNKRIVFLQEVVNSLSLNSAIALHGRAEDFARNNVYREKFDVAVSRAVANLSTLLEYLMPFVKVGGKCICMKGSDVDEELKEAEFAINVLGGKIEKIDSFCLPNSDIKRNIIIIKKIRGISDNYPRKAGIPSKSPLRKDK